MRTTLLALFMFCFWPYIVRGEPVESARADTDMLAVSQVETFPANCSVTAPDIIGWEIISNSRTEFRISDIAVAYLGLDIEYIKYRNPLNASEFVKVISRHIPLISEQNKLNERVILDAVIALYAQKEEQDLLSDLANKTDPILFMRWKTRGNSYTKQEQLDGDVDIWFLKSNGECLITKNEKVGEQFLTENITNGKPHNVFVGVRYKIGDVYHILKVNRSDVLRLMNRDEQ